jgi:hypothetical protein
VSTPRSPRPPAGGHAPELDAELDDATRSYVEAQVDDVLSGYADLLPDADLAWVRERLLDDVAGDPALRALASAARPRSVERSGELPRRALQPGVKKAAKGGRR